MDEPREIRRIGLYGPFGWGNLGDAAIQEAVIANIRRCRPEVEFVGFSLNPENTEEIHGIPSVAILRSWVRRRTPRPDLKLPGASPAASSGASEPPSALQRAKMALENSTLAPAVRWLKRALRPLAELVRELRFLARARRTLEEIDVFVISGGGQLADFWGGPFYHPYTMFKWAACARLAGCRVCVVSVGAGPIRAWLSGVFIRATLRLAHYRSYRDVESHALLAGSGFTVSDPVYPDLAFSLPVEATPAPTERGAKRPVVGISPLCYFHPAPGPWPSQNPVRYAGYLRKMVALTRSTRAAQRPALLFSSQIRNDRYAFDDLLEELAKEGIQPDGLLRAMPTESLSHVLGQIGETDVVITSRLHGVILAYRLHRPVVALSCDPKIDAAMRAFGQSHYCLDIDQTSAELLQERVEQMLAELPAVRDHIRATADENRSRLQEQYDRLFGPALDGAGQEDSR